MGKFIMRVIMASCRATRKICFLITTHSRLLSPSYKTLFTDDTGFSCCCLRLVGLGQNSCSFAEIFERLLRKLAEFGIQMILRSQCSAAAFPSSIYLLSFSRSLSRSTPKLTERLEK